MGAGAGSSRDGAERAAMIWNTLRTFPLWLWPALLLGMAVGYCGFAAWRVGQEWLELAAALRNAEEDAD